MTDWGGLLDKGLQKLDDGWEGTKKVVGQGVDKATDGIGAGLEYVGADDWADKVEDWGDDFASDMGASVGEQQLGQSEQANELVHGKPAKIRESAKHLKDFQGAFDRVGQGMRALDSGHWKGQAADAFREKFAMHPTDWLHASDACEVAAGALTRYAETVEWAQKQAQQAIDLYKAAVKAAKDAHESYAAKVETYNATAKAGRDPGPEPQKPGDVGKADARRAHEILNEARRQRDEAAGAVARTMDAALAHAPKEPSATDRALAGITDYYGGQAVELNHFVGGVVKGTAGLLNFARGLNPMDPYNLTHPAEYQQNLNMTLAGLVSTAAHPERIPGALIDSFKDDPSEGLGRLVPELLGTKGFGGARAGVRVAEAAATKPSAWSHLAKPTKGVTERPSIHADSVGKKDAQKFIDDQYPWLKDMNNTNMPGYQYNCTNNVVTLDRRLDGVEVSAAPKTGPGDIPYKELGVEPSAKKVVGTYDDIVKDLEARGPDSRSVVAISRHGMAGHVFNAVNTPHGVVFLDGQTGKLATLETHNISEIAHVPYR
ncbi:toxin glutamine deamidase domain-containing protein [Streptomyces virginiae]|uniref:putative T7SS-secreted protein n=1 Tax=Streptomyces virginiae TaxID=1961 RepID=UPI0022543270|nr:toxin glutamine deamidase domain-containing protein [Streptomyces virginiae]MCX4714794.1 toxin glutamine deamidase domain-containing protein [Streptomyces virginiae]